MNDLLLLIAQNALLLLGGTTLLLAAGCGVLMLCNSPVHRQRISELTIVGVLGWMVLALFPLPRLLPEIIRSAQPPAIVSVKPELPIAFDAVWPVETGSPTLLPVVEIPPVERVVLPEVTQWVQETRSDDDLPNADGPGRPSYGPSPSEEIPRRAAEVGSPWALQEKTASTRSAWQLDSTKLAGFFTGAYLAGGSLCLLWILAGYALLLRIRQTAESPPEWLQDQHRSLAQKSGLAPPRLIVSRW